MAARRGGVTLHDVAGEAGVSLTTAADILRNAPGLRASADTRNRVQEASARLGYRRNAIAVSLQKGRTEVIGILLPLGHFTGASRIPDAYAQSLFVAVFKAASRAGLRILPVPPPSQPGETLSPSSVANGQIDGLLLCSFRDPDALAGIEAAGVPCVEVGSEIGRFSVRPDNEGGAEQAIAHLASLGHRHIAHFGSRNLTESGAGGGRARGFVAAAERWGLQTSFGNTLREIEALLRLPAAQRPTAIFAFNDDYAIQALACARQRGMRLPDELSVVGFDNTALGEVTTPLLTSVHNPLDEQADAAIALLTARIRGEETAGRRVVLPTHLVVRGSTAAAPDVSAAAAKDGGEG